MKHLHDFYMTDDILAKAQKEPQEDGSTKYTFDDGSYIIEEPREELWPGHFSDYRKFTKYETDGTRKEYEEKYEHWVAQTYVHSLPSLQKIIGPAGEKENVSFYYNHQGDRNGNAVVITVEKNGEKEKYTLFVEDVSYGYRKGENYCLTGKEYENGVSRYLYHFYEGEERSEVEYALKKMVNPQEAEDYPMIREKCPGGIVRSYRADSLATAEKMINFKGDISQEFRQFLTYEKLADGTVRKWDKNGYIKYEKIPNVVERNWEDGILKKEIFGKESLEETIDYGGTDMERVAHLEEVIKKNENIEKTRDTFLRKLLDKELAKGKDITTEKLDDGTVRTFYKGDVISENRPDGTHNTLTSYQDEKGVWHTQYPNGTPMLEWKSENDYKKWASNGNLEEASEGGFKRYYDTENKGRLVACEGFGGLYMADGADKIMLQRFKDALAKDDMKTAVSFLLGVCEAAEGSRKEYHGYDGISMLVRNSLNGTQLKVLDNGMVAFGAIFEDRHFTKETYLGGIEWYWRGAALVMDPENGSIVAQCNTARINVRDRYDPNKDKWKYIDTKDFIDFKDGTLTVRLGQYTSGSVEVNLEKYKEIVENIKRDVQIGNGMKKLKQHIEGKQTPVKPEKEKPATPKTPKNPTKPGGRDDFDI